MFVLSGTSNVPLARIVSGIGELYIGNEGTFAEEPYRLAHVELTGLIKDTPATFCVYSFL
jgi:hypothetical protein